MQSDNPVERLAGFDPSGSTIDVWHSIDGVVWNRVELPVDASFAEGTYFNVGIDDELVLVEGSDDARAWTTTDGLTYTEIPMPPGCAAVATSAG